ncbi:MAG: hypothetical protein ISR99_00415, partial [Parcubacteria group bacterium]|nr:hypothetical protein [Parcubacteria group bacterium]
MTVKHQTSRKLVSALMIVVILAPLTFTINPPEARAQAGAVGCATAALLGAGAGVAAAAAGLNVPTFDLSTFTVQATETQKECLLDGIVVLLREVLISQLVKSVVTWINSGFDGNPAFITDLRGFLTDVVDETIGTYIDSSQLSFLCSPFQLDIKIAIRINFESVDREPACTLTDVVENIDDFYKRGFGGGWKGFIDANTITGNNPFFAYLDADVRIRGRIDKSLAIELEKLKWGDGFPGFEICDEEVPGESSCQTVTPGSYVNHTLNRYAADSGINQLELADEIDEIIGALAAQLSKQLLTGAGGLLGASRSSGGRNSYLSRTVSDTESRSLSASRRAFSLSTEGGGTTEDVYLEQKNLSLSALVVASSRIEDVISCYEEKIIESDKSALSSFEELGKLTPAERALAVSRIEQASSTISSNINPLRFQIERDIANSEDNIVILRDIGTRIDAATTQREIELINENELNPLVESGLLHTLGDVSKATQQKLDVNNLTDDINKQTTDRQRACDNFPRAIGSGSGVNDGGGGSDAGDGVGDGTGSGSGGGS